MAAAYDTAADSASPQIAWEEVLDPSLRDATNRYLHSLLAATPDATAAYFPGENDAIRVAIQRRLKEIPSYDSNSAGGIGCAAVLLIVITVAISNFKSLPVVIAVGIVSAMIVTALIAVEVQRSRRYHDTRRQVTEEVFPLALEQVAQNRTERAYLAAIQEMIPPSTEGYLTPEMRTEQIQGLNTLLASGRRLETVRAEITAVLKDAKPDILQEEAAVLQQKVERATDEATKNTLLRSLALCEERLSRNKSLYTLLERLDAESELVHQVFGATRSSLASLRIAPTSAELYPLEETVRVSEVADTLALQTRSVEAAVQELGIRGS